MKSTKLCPSRALRYFMATTPTRTLSSTNDCIDSHDTNINSQDKMHDRSDIDTAHRITASLVLQHKARRQQQQQQRRRCVAPELVLPEQHDRTTTTTADGKNYKNDKNDNSTPLRSGSVALGRSAYLVHAAHQPQHQHLSTTELLSHAHRVWRMYSAGQRVHWLQTTPQGREAFKALGCEQQQADGFPSSSSPLSTAKHMFTAFPTTPRMSRHAASAAETPIGTTSGQRWLSSQRAAALRTYVTASTEANRRVIAREVSTAVGRMQKALWKRHLHETLGREGATVFAQDVKELQAVVGADGDDDGGASSTSSASADRTNDADGAADASETPTPSFSASRATHHHHHHHHHHNHNEKRPARVYAALAASPRKVYVLNRLMPILSARDPASVDGEAEAATASALTMKEVEELTQKYSDEYDAECQRLGTTTNTNSGLAALAAFREELQESERDRLQEKLDAFSASMPFLKRYMEAPQVMPRERLR